MATDPPKHKKPVKSQTNLIDSSSDDDVVMVPQLSSTKVPIISKPAPKISVPQPVQIVPPPAPLQQQTPAVIEKPKEIDDSTTPPLPPALQTKFAAVKAAALAATAAIKALEEKEKALKEKEMEELNSNGNSDKMAKGVKEPTGKRADWDMFAEQDLDSNFDVS